MDKRTAVCGCARVGLAGMTLLWRLLARATVLILAFGALAHASTITINPAPTGGTVSSNVGGINCGTGGAACVSADIPAGTSVTMTATADAGYVFVHYSVAGIGTITQNPATLPMPPFPVSASATFQAIVTATVASLMPASKTLVAGDTASLTVTISAAQPGDTIVAIDVLPLGLVSAGPSVTVLAGQTTTSVPVTALATGTATVSATIGASSAGATIQVIPVAVAPDAPTSAAATPGDHHATVTFVAPVSDGGAAITSYTATSSPGGLTASAPGSPIIVTGLTNLTSYTFTVTATNSAGTSSPSSPSNSVVPPGLLAPTIASVTLSGSLQMDVVVQPPPSDGGSPITLFTVTSTPGGITASAPPNGPSTTITVTGLTRGTSYMFSATATNAFTTSAPSDLSGSNLVIAYATPGMPTGVTAVADSGRATVSFTAPDNGGDPDVSYTVTSSPSAITAVGTASPIVVTGLTNGTAYTFTVRASNSAGAGPASSPSNVVTPSLLSPGAPRDVRAMAGDGHATVSFVPPVSNGGSAITSYVVTSSPGSFVGAGAQSPVDVPGLANGTAYTFTVVAVNGIGTGPASTASNAITPAAIAPRNGPRAYITSSLDNLVAVIDTRTRRVITTIPVGLGPSGVAVNPSGTRVYVANSVAGTMSVIDAGANAVLATIPVGANPSGVAVNAAGTRVYVSNSNDNTVSIIDAGSNGVIATVPLGTYPSAIAISPVTGAVAVAASISGAVRFIDGSSNLITGSTSLTFAPLGLAYSSNGNLVAAGQGPTNDFSLINGTVVTSSARVANLAFGAAANPVSGIVYVADSGLNNLLVVNGTAVTATVPVGNGPVGVAVTPTGAHAYVVNQNGNTVSVVRTSDNTVIDTIPVGNGPAAAGLFIGPAVPPAAPTSAVATAGNAQASVAFTAPSNDGGAPITSYTVTASPGGIASGGSTSPIVVPGLTNGIAYTFTVAATNAAGTGPASAASNSVTPMTVPSAPIAVSATIGNGQATVSFSAPASNGGAAISGYTVTCTPGPIQATGATSPITVTGLTNGTAYSCSVRAANAVGTGAASTSVNVTPTVYAMSVTKSGSGSGTVTSSPVGIDCGATCSANFSPAASVALFAAPAAGSAFSGWSGACSGMGACLVTMDAAKSVTAAFDTTAHLGNISTRMQVLTGNDVMIGGFVIDGTSSKTVAIVATGPSLTAFGIPNALANPTLKLVRSSDQAVIAINDDWQSASNAAQLQAAGFAPSNALEAAILINLLPGAYTAIVSGVGGGTGVGLVAVYEVDHPDVPLINISTRGKVLTGNDVMIGGFVIQGTGTHTVAIVATGPSLSAFGIANPLANPTLTLVRSSDQSVIAVNDDWQSAGNAAQLQTAGFAPSNPLESAILITLPPGAYTAIVSGVGGGTGVSVVAVYAVD